MHKTNYPNLQAAQAKAEIKVQTDLLKMQCALLALRFQFGEVKFTPYSPSCSFKQVKPFAVKH